MTDQKDNKEVQRTSERGNGLAVVLVVLAIIAVGALAFLSGKLDGIMDKTENTQTAEAQNADGEAPANPVLAKVNGKDVTQQDVIALIQKMPPQMQQVPMPQLFPMALEQLINDKVVDKQSKSASLSRDPDVKKQLAEAKEQIIRTKFLENAVEAAMTEERLKTKYQEYLDNFPKIEEVKASHILLETKKEAQSAISKIKKGSDFAELAKELSKDQVSAEKGGDVGYFAKTDVVPEFSKVAFETKPGEYTKTPVKTEFGYHVIKVADKRERPPASFEQIKPYIEKDLQRVVLQELITDWKEMAQIERFDAQGNPLPEQQAPAAGGDAAAAPAAPEQETPAAAAEGAAQ